MLFEGLYRTVNFKEAPGWPGAFLVTTEFRYVVRVVLGYSPLSAILAVTNTE